MQEISTRSPARKVGDACSDLVDHADAFVPEDPALGHRRHIAFQDVEVGPADRRGGEADDGVGRSRSDGAAALPRRAGRDRDTRVPS